MNYIALSIITSSVVLLALFAIYLCASSIITNAYRKLTGPRHKGEVEKTLSEKKPYERSEEELHQMITQKVHQKVLGHDRC